MIRPVLVFSTLLVGGSPALAASELTGIWLRDDGNARVRIAPCGAKVCATNLWIGDTSAGEEVGDQLVMTITRQVDGSFEGSAYDPKRRWNLSLTVKASRDSLNTRGCLLGRFLCREVMWRSAD
jgi:uncharacterized protein (DUF2147 family)